MSQTARPFLAAPSNAFLWQPKPKNALRIPRMNCLRTFVVFFPNAELIRRVVGRVRVSRAARSPEMIRGRGAADPPGGVLQGLRQHILAPHQPLLPKLSLDSSSQDQLNLIRTGESHNLIIEVRQKYSTARSWSWRYLHSWPTFLHGGAKQSKPTYSTQQPAPSDN